MVYRRIALQAAFLAAVVGIAALAFTSFGHARTAQASGISNLHCSFSPAPPPPNNPDELTCTFTHDGTGYTFVADFSYTTQPFHLTVSSCTLSDGTTTRPVHIGPCP